AVLQTFGNNDPACIASHQARFASPVFPGDILTVDLWREEPGIVSFEARVEARGVKVISNGKTVLCV
ncbi:MAG: 3-alpha,7-alpha,12-alpha-trihydroxy-5-beta-cholest-24-enoyl-CoA hydratase, partial [bacterium]